jgi:hypothetical protein
MKIEKSFELLNSEGPIIKIEKIQGNWHYKFNGSRQHHITTAKEILSAIWNNSWIIDYNGNKNYRLGDYPISMKGDDPKYYDEIVKYLIEEETEKMCKDPNYLKENYLTT